MLKETSQIKLLIKWSIFFFIGNTCLLFLIGLNYFFTKPWVLPHNFYWKVSIILKLFIVISYIGQFALIAFLPMVVILPFIIIVPRWRWVACVAILSATSIALWITIDTILYNLYRFHFNTTLFHLTLESLTQNVFAISLFEEVLILSYVIFLIVIEWGYGWWLWRYLQKKPSVSSKWIVGSCALCLYLSYTGFLVSQVPLTRYLLDTARFLPLYYDVLGILTLQKEGSIAISRFNEHQALRPDNAAQRLQYPLKPLVCSSKAPQKNIVIIGVDTWRFDMIDKTVMPHTYNFTQQSWQFTHHFSGGNSTGPGLFSLFYSIPATYWTAMIQQQRRPILFEELEKQGYQIGIFNSSNLRVPPVFRNIFYGLKDLNIEQQPATSPNRRDALATQNFMHFVQNQKKQQPFFSFIFYDSAHSYCTTDVKDQPFLPIALECLRFNLSKKIDGSKYLNRYKNAIYFVDQQIHQVIDALRAENLLENTIVIITGDHGEEFDDNGLGYWGHTGNFTRYQVQTPLIIYMPGHPPQIFNHRTSHFDIVPTLLEEVLQCENARSDYSVGKLLLDSALRPYLLIGSYVDFSVVEPDRITTIFPTGYFSIEAPNGQNISNVGLNAKVIEQAFREMRQFYQT